MCAPSSGSDRLKIYGYHLVMLALAFTVVAAFAVHTHKAALTNLLNFYLAHPVVAIVGSVLLLYCPPLLDILPMYVTFLFFTPVVLSAAVRWGWKWILAASGLVWMLAQFGLRDLVHNWVVHLTHLRIPLQETGAFNLFAWQGVWIVGLWLGARIGHRRPRSSARSQDGWRRLSAAACLFFVGIRFGWLGPHLTTAGARPEARQMADRSAAGRQPACVHYRCLYWRRKYLVKLVAIEPFLTLGKASLQVFCAHLFFVFVGLALLYGDFNADGLDQLHGLPAIALLAVTFTALICRGSQRGEEEARPEEAPDPSAAMDRGSGGAQGAGTCRCRWTRLPGSCAPIPSVNDAAGRARRRSGCQPGPSDVSSRPRPNSQTFAICLPECSSLLTVPCGLKQLNSNGRRTRQTG